VDLTNGKKATQAEGILSRLSDFLRRIESMTNLLVTVVVLSEGFYRKSNSVSELSWLQMSLALCAKVDSKECLLAG
jgi:hypothetical protein